MSLRSPAGHRLRSDEQLVRAFRRGDEGAFAAIDRRHRRRLLGAAVRVLGGRGDAEGVVQETLLRAHAALRADGRRIELGPWLHRMVRNRCIDELRRHRDAAPLDEERLEAAGQAVVEDAFSALSRRDELRRLIEDLSDLPEQQRAALLMRELDGLTHEQVAAALDVSPAASRQLVRRARDTLAGVAASRDADCDEVRRALGTAHDERRRPGAHELRHVRACSSCSAYRDSLRAVRGGLRSLVPALGFGPLAGILAAAGQHGGGAAAAASGAGGAVADGSAASAGAGGSVAASAGAGGLLGGTAAKVAAGCCALAVGSGTGFAVLGGEQTVRSGERSVGVEAGGKTLMEAPIRPGTTLRRGVSISTVLVRLPAEVRPSERTVRVRCPVGGAVAGLAEPRDERDRPMSSQLRQYQLSSASVDALATRRRREASIELRARPGLVAPLQIRVGVLCRPQASASGRASSPSARALTPTGAP